LLGVSLVRISLRTCVLMLTVLLVVASLGMSGLAYPVNAQDHPIEITNVNIPDELPQADRGEVSATVYNPVNETFEGFAQFSDNISEITCTMFNFTIGYKEEVDVTVEYTVHENATLGNHLTTFEICVGYFSYTNQYQLEVIPVATITSLTAGQVFLQGQTGFLLVDVENRVNRVRHVRLDTYGVNFTNISQEIDIAPGINTIVISVKHNMSHFFDFGMCPVNVSLYYGDALIDSAEGIIPIDMLVLNKVVGVIVPVLIFEFLVLFYVFRKIKRSRTTSET
jgi:hypothetical protein